MPTVTQVKGQTYSTSFEASSHVLQIDKQMHGLQPFLSPYITMMTSKYMGGSKGVKNSTFYHYEDEPLPNTATITTATAAATLNVYFANDYVYLATYDILMNERTKQVIQITDATIDANALTYVTVAGTDQGSQVDDVYRRMPPAFSEGGTAGSVRMTVEVKKTHYLQKIRRAIEMTREAELTETYFGSKRARELVKTSAQIKIEREFAAFFMGGTSDTTADPVSSNYTCPASHGLYHSISTHANKTLGTLTLSEMRSECNKASVHHPEREWFVFTSPRNLGIVDDLVAGKIQLQNMPNDYGINIKTLDVGGNKLHLVSEPLWNTEYLQKVMMFVPAPIETYFSLHHLEGYPISWYRDTKKDDSNDTIKDEIKGWYGQKIVEEKRFILLDGINS